MQTLTMMEQKENTPKTISGIDTLYYFYETNENYDDLFLEILDQYEDAKGAFEKREIVYEKKDIKISISNIAFYFNGKDMGFYWFTQADDFFTIGFKDSKINRGLNDIQVQFNAIGIYMLGIPILLQYVDALLKDYVTGYRPITRVDLNIFVQSDLSWIDKTMFVTRKRRYTTLYKEVANKHKLETLYIGKKPFLLRLYDKREELKKSHKRDMMFHHFMINGFDVSLPIFNVEFEIHRDTLKEFKIDTVDDMLERAVGLFQYSMNAIRMVDLTTFTDNTQDAKNKNRALTHPLWAHLTNAYQLQEFFAIDAPLERIKRKNYLYTIENALTEVVTLLKKCYIHNVIVDEMFMMDALKAFKRTIRPHKDVIINFQPEKKVLLCDMAIGELVSEIRLVESEMIKDDLDLGVLIKQHKILYQELERRGINSLDEEVF